MEKKRLATGILVFLLGLVTGLLCCNLHTGMFSAKQLGNWNKEGSELTLQGVDLVEFSLVDSDIAIIACLAPEMENLRVQIDELTKYQKENSGVHLFYVWDGYMPEGLRLSEEMNSYVWQNDDVGKTPCYFIVDADYTILHKANSFNELVGLLAAWKR